ncbi:MAG: peptidylprolyl isomerase [Gemmatimonadales bacterium]
MGIRRPSIVILVVVALASACQSHSPVLSPTPHDLAWVGPDSFLVELRTSRGPVLIAAHRAWSPLAVDRFHFLVRHRYYDGARFFRMIPGFVAQWGLAADPALSAVWTERRLPDEPVRQSNTRGRVAYARGGPNTRSVQLYVNLGNNGRLDTLNTFGFPPIGEVVQGLGLLDSMYAGYSCQRGSQGTCPSQDSIRVLGNTYLERIHPRLDFIREARVIREWKGGNSRR